MSSEQMLTETACQLKEFLASKNVMGEPTDFEEKVVIPIARFGFGFGSGGVQAKDAVAWEQEEAGELNRSRLSFFTRMSKDQRVYRLCPSERKVR